MPAATSMAASAWSVQRFERRRTAAIEGRAAHQAVLLDQLQVLGARDEPFGAAIDHPLGDAAVAVAEASRARRLGDDPDLTPVVLLRHPPGAIVPAYDAGFAEQCRFRSGHGALGARGVPAHGVGAIAIFG